MDCGQVIAEVLPELVENVRRIHAHGRRAEEIVAAMQLHGHDSNESYAEIRVDDFFRSHTALAVRGFQSRFPGFECHLDESSVGDVDVFVTKPGELSGVIVSLVDNACYAMRERVAEDASYLPVLEVRTYRDVGGLVFEVGDNGAGIPPSERRMIFDPFYTTKPPGEGTGLGLSSSYEVVTKLGGVIEVHSRIGGGTVFRVRLPDHVADLS